MTEHEITSPVALTDSRGALNPAALGWTRIPLHDTSGIPGGRAWGRNKRWEYWCVMTPTHILALTVSCIDYLSLHSVWVLDRTTGEELDSTVLSPGGRSATLPGSLGDGPVRARTRTVNIDIEDSAEETTLRGTTPRVSFDVAAARPAGHESLGVVVPWRKGDGVPRFQYTVKDVARPARGSIMIDGTSIDIPEGSWAVLDHGRGRWPYRVWWNWAAGSGVVGDRTIGLQLGSKWTDGSGMTENAVVVDGRVTKIGEEFVWDYDADDWMAPWHIHGTGADLTFTPFHNKHSRTNALLVSTRTDQLFGVWTGWVAGDDGIRVDVGGIEGFAEDVLNRW
ncbi:hypothetical protein HD600_002893 [Microbacterium ginsengiterrae]|uniref:DUF2804 domain-containing protein n=1 Tax=Microbacterium ginsengiterrae TaxID=546115 RepID=A0A7W9CF48_9MICO|nr:DUF2804 domain-containing protein [Microbacterium ginsengiterrae]MBB5744396.1 hypothetical protein [Microbacterium ginsengiterrae]